MKQTAVEWLIEELEENGIRHLDLASDIIEQALGLEKQRLMDAYGQGVADEAGEILDVTKDAEQYYNRTYKSK
jgi:hypothetical protein